MALCRTVPFYFHAVATFLQQIHIRVSGLPEVPDAERSDHRRRRFHRPESGACAARPDDRLTVVDAMTYAANVRSLEPLIADRSIEFVKGDFRDAALMRRLFDEYKFTRVAHLAAESHVGRSIADPEASLQTNVLGTFDAPPA